MPASDDRIVQRVREGHTEAFGDLVATHEKAVYAMAVAATSNVADAEDLTQSCFVEAFRRIGELRDGRRFASWLYAIARNRCRDWLRKHSRRPVLLGDPSNLRGADPPELPGNPGGHSAASDRASTVRAAVNSLPPDYRAVVLLRYVGELTYKEISQALGVKVPTLKVRCHRARQMLRDRLADRARREREDG